MGKEEWASEPVKALTTLLEGHRESDVPQMTKRLSENEKAFREYFGEQYNDFFFGLRSVTQGIEFYEKDDFEVRENFIHENFRDYYETYDVKKCFGMFGGAHTLLDGSFGESSNLAAFMNEEFEATKGKVCRALR